MYALNLCSGLSMLFETCWSRPYEENGSQLKFQQMLGIPSQQKIHTISCCTFPCFTYKKETVSNVELNSLDKRVFKYGDKFPISLPTLIPAMELAPAPPPIPIAPLIAITPSSSVESVPEIFSRWIKEGKTHLVKWALKLFPLANLHIHATPTVMKNLEYAARKGMFWDCDKKIFVLENGPNRISAQEMLITGDHFQDYYDAVTMRSVEKDKSKEHFFEAFAPIMSTQMPVDEIILSEIENRESKMRYLELTIDLPKQEKPDLNYFNNFSIDDMQGSYERIEEWAQKYSKYWKCELNKATAKIQKKLNWSHPLSSPKNPCTIGLLVEIMRTVSSDYSKGENPLATFFADCVGAFFLCKYDPDLSDPSLSDPNLFVGFSLVGPEGDPRSAIDFLNHMRVLEFLGEKFPDVNIALHAGEITSSDSEHPDMRNRIRDSIVMGGAKRIGHGSCIQDSDDAIELLEMMKARRVTVEICITSNEQILGINPKNHPLKIYADHGVSTVLATDDPWIFGITLPGEALRALTEVGLSYEKFRESLLNSMRYSFKRGKDLYKKKVDGYVVRERFKPLMLPDVDLSSQHAEKILNGSEKAYLQIIFERQIHEAEEAIIKMGKDF